ncbi:MAG: DUF349 domain-containing protein [Muribaculaceae bacterium]|nr:DUF349 domain-containing protein [Muribaculaceae bacterium]
METNESSLHAATGAEEILNPAPQAGAEAPDGADEQAVEMEMTDAIEHEETNEAAAEAVAAEAADEQHHRPATAEETIAAACDILAREAADISSDDVRRLRSTWNSLHAAAPADGEGAEADDAAVAARVKQEEMFAAILAQIKDKKAAWAAEQEAARAANLERKNAIIEEIIALADDTDNVNRTFPRYRELQDEFNAIGDVEPTEETGVWKRFQDARERFSDNLKINKELRDYDFKKNLDSKTLLLEEAESLGAEEDVITAYRRLQELHNKWRRIGPVAKELREEIWEKFKAASAVVNKRYQAYFEERKAQEAEAEAAKVALCEQVEAIDTESLGGFGAWDKATATIQELQGKWRELGYASRKANRDLFGRFRAACDKFFAAKAEYFRNTREQLAANLAAKTALADEAEALKDSTEWTKAGARFVAMQQEWRPIGPVAKRHSDAVWRRFMDACNHFFEQKKKAGSGRRNEENANLAAKRALVDRLNALSAEAPRAELLAAIKEIQDEWQTIGHVPFREKDKVYEQYRARLDELRDGISDGRRRERREQFAGAVARMEGDTAGREHDRLARVLEAKRSELRTLENNLGFLNAKSKSGNSLVRDFERKIERLREDIAEIAEKLKMLAK